MKIYFQEKLYVVTFLNVMKVVIALDDELTLSKDIVVYLLVGQCC